MTGTATVTRTVPVECACGADMAHTIEPLGDDRRRCSLYCPTCGAVGYIEVQTRRELRAMVRGRMEYIGSYWGPG